MKLKVKGLKQLERNLEEMQEGLTVRVLNEWTGRILETARSQLPPEPTDALHLQFLQREGNHFDIEFRISDEYVEPFKKAVEGLLEQMPTTTQQTFRMLLDQIKTK